MSSQQDTPKPSRLARLVKIVVHVLLAGFLLALVAKFWILPGVIRKQVRSAIARRWQGPVALEAAEFNYFGPISLRGLRLADANGQEWLRVGQVTLSLRDFPGLSPRLTGIHVDTVRLGAHFAAGRCRLPLRDDDDDGDGDGDGDGAKDYLDLQTVRIDDLALAVVDHDGDRQCVWRLGLAADRDPAGHYAVRLTQRAPTTAPTPVLSGTVDPQTLRSDLRVRLRQDLSQEHVAVLLGAIRAAALARTGGFLDADVRVTGPLDRPAALSLVGAVELADASAVAKAGRIVDDLDLRIRLNAGQAILHAEAQTPVGGVQLGETPIVYDLGAGVVSAKIDHLVAQSAPGDPGGFWRALLGGASVRGRVFAVGLVRLDANGPRPIDFDVDVKGKIDEVRFANSPDRHLRNATAERLRIRTTRVDARDVEATFARGHAKLTGSVYLAAGDAGEAPGLANWANVSRLSGSGLLVMDDVDLLAVPVLPDLLTVMQVLPKGQRGLSDLHVLFELDRGVVRIEEGKLANPVSALHAERGGAIDLARKHLDLHVVVVGIKQLRTVLRAIPLIKLAVGFKDKLTRFAIRGPWDEPAAKLIRKEPIRDLAKGTEDFFKGVVDTGGQIGPGLVKGLHGLGTLLKKLDKQLKKRPATTGPADRSKGESP